MNREAFRLWEDGEMNAIEALARTEEERLRLEGVVADLKAQLDRWYGKAIARDREKQEALSKLEALECAGEITWGEFLPSWLQRDLEERLRQTEGRDFILTPEVFATHGVGIMRYEYTDYLWKGEPVLRVYEPEVTGEPQAVRATSTRRSEWLPKHEPKRNGRLVDHLLRGRLRRGV